MQYQIVDFDDFQQNSNGLHLLYQIKAETPEFKATLFTIPALCSENFLNLVRKLDWLDLCPHGWTHMTSTECKEWSYEESKQYLGKIKPYKFSRVFKAPGWQISDGMYRALLEEGYTVADQAYNNERRPKGLKAYLLDSPDKHHYHIKNVCGNGLKECFNEILNLKGEFKFIKELQ